MDHALEFGERSQLGFYRAFCWLLFTLYPGWSLFLFLAMPEEYDSAIGRLTVGGLCFVAYLMSHLNSWAKQNLESIVYCLFWVMVSHFMWMVYQAQMSTIYVMGSFILIVALDLGFTKRQPLIYFTCLVIGLSMVVGFASSAPLGHRLMLTAGLLTVQIVSITGIELRLRAMKQLDAEKTKSQVLRQQLIQKDLDAAQAVQKTLLIELPQLETVELAAYYRSAEQTGGDWYGQYYDEKSEVLYLWIGDVTGHGTASALVTAVACGAIYSGEKRFDLVGGVHRGPEQRLLDMVTVVNDVICSTGGNLFMTMQFCALDLKTGALSTVNAGHNFPWRQSAQEKNILPIKNGANPLGFDAKSIFKVATTHLTPGDKVFLYTDGLIENAGVLGKRISKTALRKALAADQSAQEVINQIVALCDATWQQEPIQDDITMFVVRWKPASQTLKSA